MRRAREKFAKEWARGDTLCTSSLRLGEILTGACEQGDQTTAEPGESGLRLTRGGGLPVYIRDGRWLRAYPGATPGGSRRCHSSGRRGHGGRESVAGLDVNLF